MNSKNKTMLIFGLLLIFLAVFYFYNYMYLKDKSDSQVFSQSVPAVRIDKKLDVTFFSDLKLNELRENKTDLVPMSQLNMGNKDLFRKR
jgi:hypothetical protein